MTVRGILYGTGRRRTCVLPKVRHRWHSDYALDSIFFDLGRLAPHSHPDATTRMTGSGTTIATVPTIEEAYARISADIRACATGCGRAHDTVRLLAVSKTRSAREIERAYRAGAREFGENYLQDALPKRQALAHHEAIVWHYIGAVQSNKTAAIATEFDWVHTVDRSKIARRLNDARAAVGTPLNICLQVNLHGEAQKAGCAPAELSDLAQTVIELPNLALRGLMILPAIHVSPAQAFDATAALFEELSLSQASSVPHWDTLSMGMSSDYPAAIAAGSTLVRIGTALFGPRAQK